jgi:hypothetical protein
VSENVCYGKFMAKALKRKALTGSAHDAGSLSLQLPTQQRRGSGGHVDAAG